MAIFRMQRNIDNFTILTNDLLNDARLSFKARGLLCYLLSKPRDWQVSSAQLTKASPQGMTAIRSALKELKECGYAQLISVQGEDGKMTGKYWAISDLPSFPQETATDSEVF